MPTLIQRTARAVAASETTPTIAITIPATRACRSAGSGRTGAATRSHPPSAIPAAPATRSSAVRAGARGRDTNAAYASSATRGSIAIAHAVAIAKSVLVRPSRPNCSTKPAAVTIAAATAAAAPASVSFGRVLQRRSPPASAPATAAANATAASVGEGGRTTSSRMGSQTHPARPCRASASHVAAARPARPSATTEARCPRLEGSTAAILARRCIARTRGGET